MADEIKVEGLASRWQKLDGQRHGHLERCRQCAALTLPALLPPEGADGNTELPTPNQGVGARAVNNLANKYLLTVLPPNTPMFRYKVDAGVEAEMLKWAEASGQNDLKTTAEEQLGTYENVVTQYLDTLGLRVPAFRLIRLHIGTGNALRVMRDSGVMSVYRLDQYVVRRNPDGDPQEMIIEEKIDPQDVPEKIRGQIVRDKEDASDSQYLNLYTQYLLKDDKWIVRQEVGGVPYPEATGTYKKDECPAHPMTYNRADGENYGRGLVEEYLGDFISLDVLSKALNEGGAAAAKILFLVNPNGMTNPRDLINAHNLGFVSGRAEDIQTLLVEKLNDFSFVKSQVEVLTKRIEQAFLLHTAVQRDAERVTAEEIRYIANQLNEAHGGIYANFAEQFQLPLIKWAMRKLTSAKKLPAFPKDIMPVIITGLDALGRGHDLEKLNAFLGQIAPLGEEVIAKYVNIPDYLTRVATALSITQKGLVKSKDELMQEEQMAQQQMAQQQMMQSPAVREAVKGAMGGMAGAQPPQEVEE